MLDNLPDDSKQSRTAVSTPRFNARDQARSAGTSGLEMDGDLSGDSMLRSPLGSAQVVESLTISSTAAAAVIGRGGVNLKRIMQETVRA